MGYNFSLIKFRGWVGFGNDKYKRSEGMLACELEFSVVS